MSANDITSEQELNAIVDRLELVNVRAFELTGRRKDGGFEDLQLPGDDWVEPDKVPEIQFYVQQDDKHLSIRGVVEVENRIVSCRADVAVTYAKSQPIEVTEDHMAEFISRVALANVYPFMRQHVYDLSSRLGSPLTLGLMKIRPGMVTANSADDLGADES